VPQIIAELVTANESEKRACVVVLARTDKTEMEEALRDELRDTKTTRVVIRNGDPSLPSDLERVCVADARSIVAVRDEDGDASVIKAVLAVRALDPTHARSHVVAELNDPTTPARCARSPVAASSPSRARASSPRSPRRPATRAGWPPSSPTCSTSTATRSTSLRSRR
jgi:hypothetical protein